MPLVNGFCETLYVHASHHLHCGQMHVFRNKVRYHLHEGAEHFLLQYTYVHQSPVYRYPVSSGMYHVSHFGYDFRRVVCLLGHGIFHLVYGFLQIGVSHSWHILNEFRHLSYNSGVHVLSQLYGLIGIIAGHQPTLSVLVAPESFQCHLSVHKGYYNVAVFCRVAVSYLYLVARGYASVYHGVSVHVNDERRVHVQEFLGHVSIFVSGWVSRHGGDTSFYFQVQIGDRAIAK